MSRLLYAGHLLKRCVPQRWTALASKQSVELSKPFTVSSAVHVPTNKSPSGEGDKNTKPASLEFSDKAYAERPTGELLRAWSVYNMFRFEFLVDRGEKLITWSKKHLGPRLFRKVMRATVYGQFVAGENLKEVRPVMDELRKKGIRSILDYAVEDVTGSTNILAKCEQNRQNFMECIDVAAEASGEGDAFAAIKLTALGDPKILEQQTRELRVMLWLFKELADQPSFVKGTLTMASLHAGLSKHQEVSEGLVDTMFREIDANRSGKLDILQWQDSFQPSTQLYDYISKHAEKIGTPNYLQSQSDQERDEWYEIQARAEDVARHACTRKVRLLVDAEQTCFQLAIRDITINLLMPKYNKEMAAIYNTQQCYLKDVEEMVGLDLLAAKQKGFLYAAKLVRGAYMEHEKGTAREKGYVDPVCDSKEDTDKQYHQMLERLLVAICESGMKYELMVASHNEESVQRTVKLMDEKGIDKDSGSVSFGQLLGMCDHVSLTLGQAGYHIYKYMPYGPVEEVLPYLLRRATENKGVLKGAVRERKLLAAELKRRLFPTFLRK